MNLVQLVEPTRFSTNTVDEISSTLNANQAVARHIRHHKEITEIFRKMYADVAFKISPSKMNLSIFRSQPYFQELERTMEELVQWGAPEKQVSGSGKAGFGSSKPEKSGGKKMGFGK